MVEKEQLRWNGDVVRQGISGGWNCFKKTKFVWAEVHFERRVKSWTLQVTRTQCYSSYAKKKSANNACKRMCCCPSGMLHSCFHLLSIFSLCLALSSSFEYKNTLMAIISSVTLYLWTWCMLPFISPYFTHHTQPHKQLFSSFVSLIFHVLSLTTLSSLI